MTLAQQLIEQGRAQGIEQGLEQGLALGERRMLMRQLKRRFGELPEGVVERINGATPDELEQWTDKILTASAIEEVFA